MKEYDLFLPLTYNDGMPIEAKIFKALRLRLLEQFDGVTFFPQPNEGYWRMGGVTYKDEIVVFRVVTARHARARRYFKELKEELKKRLKQEEILIIERDVEAM